MLPISSQARVWTSPIDAIFTATSAVCVTGLVVHDTATYWSAFGQSIILILIEIGGMGIITLAIALTMISGRKIGLFQRSTMQEAISAHSISGIVRLTGFILKVTLAVQLFGAILLFFVFRKTVGIGKGIWYAIFHSVSAFCNAGFDLMGFQEHYSSLTSFSDNLLINFVICFLIIFGGIGFLTWDDLFKKKYHFSKYRMQTKVILLVTALLLLIPTLYFYFVEFSSEQWSYMSQKEQILTSFFQAVTPRTAGFNTVDLAKTSSTSQFIIILLMLIGGSPGSTAGGMKTTTLAVLLVTTFSVFRRKEDAQCFRRRIPTEAAKNALAVAMMYFSLFFISGITISVIEDIPIVTSLFEVGSAIGTVGLSLGLTPELSTCSHIILICLMYLGRVGGLTIIFAASSNYKPAPSKYPQEKITVG